ncbi:hypothetical protein [Ulvibacterium sp.]|uniref:CopG family ribbon-helix-helix protein n=1 Tax=Ulvibacterium sp. TaxID=2665914 RepID=UPI0026087A28|nr:hypothetical protein [Ulvibacterium sp.]
MKGVERITISIQDKVFRQLEKLMKSGKWKKRSQVISHLIQKAYDEMQSHKGNMVMAGSLTLFYRESQREIHETVATIQRENINEIISSNRVLLEDGYVMEILVVQGHVKKLFLIKQNFITIKGVEVGKLALTSSILPPVEPKKP